MHRFLKSFIRNKSGSIAPAFAGGVIPIMFLAGAAVDYSAQAKNTSYVSNMADSALLSVSQNVSELVETVTDEAELKVEVKNLLDPLLTSSLESHEDVSYEIDTVEYDETSEKLKIEIEVTQKTTFMQLAKVEEIKSTVTTGVRMGAEKIKGALSIALVVDKSGSMDDDWGKLKNSVKSLKNTFATIDPTKKYIRAGHVLYDSNSYGFFGMDWGMQKSWKEFKKAKYIPKGGQKTNSSDAIVEAYDKLRTQAENNAHKNKNTSAVRKVVVFFSDGVNDHAADTISTASTCEDIKTAGIEIFSIMFGYKEDTTAIQMMTDCATDTAHYFRVQDRDKLQEAFDAIGDTATERIVYLSN